MEAGSEDPQYSYKLQLVEEFLHKPGKHNHKCLIYNLLIVALSKEKSFKIHRSSSNNYGCSLLDSDLAEIGFELGNDVSAIESVPTALFCFLRGCLKFKPGK